MVTHNRTYIAPSHTNKIFANMRRQGKRFPSKYPIISNNGGSSSRKIGEGSEMPTDPHHTPITTQPSSSQPQKKQKSRRPKRKDTENTKTAQAQEITSLKLRVKRLEKKGGSRTHKLKRLYKGRYGDEDMFGVHDLDGDEVVVESEVTAKAGEKRNIVEEAVVVTDVVTIPSVESTTTISSQQLSQAKIQDKGKEKMIEPEHVKKLLKKDQLMLDEEVAQRLQAREQEKITIEERAKLFQQPLEKRRKHFAAKRIEEKRNIPQTRVQQKNIMCTYLKNMAGKKVKDLKNKSFDSIKKMFDKAFKRVNIFVDFRTELVEGSSKRAGDKLEQESTKKQKMDDVKETTEVDEDKETAELQSLMEVIPDEEEVAVDAIPLATKPPSIVDWKIHKEGQTSYYQITRADGSSKMYLVFSQLLKSFDREDLETLWRLVKAKHGYTRPEEGYERVL
ncbi:hypothetical protein Tco_1140131 [Tanacetum coccineum]